MQETKNLLNRLMNFKILAILITIVVMVSYLSLSAGNVVKVNGTKSGNAPFFQNGDTYVPLNEIAEKMGDKVTAVNKSKKVVIQQKNGNTISVTSGQALAIYKGKMIPLKTKEINKVVVPVNIKAISKNGQVYVPIEFLSAKNGMNYPIKIEGNTIYVGTIPSPTQQPSESNNSSDKNETNHQTNANKPSESEKPDSNKEVNSTPKEETKPNNSSDGWVAPVLKSSWSPNHQTNLDTLQNELGFWDGGRIFGVTGRNDAIQVVGQSPTDSVEVELVFFMWDGDSNGAMPEAYRIPIIAKELFKLYFEDDATRVWNYFNKNDIPESFTANGRQVKASYVASSGAVVLKVGRK